MPPRPAPVLDLPTYDFTGRRTRLVPPPPALPMDAEPSPLLDAIRKYLDRVS